MILLAGRQFEFYLAESGLCGQAPSGALAPELQESMVRLGVCVDGAKPFTRAGPPPRRKRLSTSSEFRGKVTRLCQ